MQKHKKNSSQATTGAGSSRGVLLPTPISSSMRFAATSTTPATVTATATVASATEALETASPNKQSSAAPPVIQQKPLSRNYDAARKSHNAGTTNIANNFNNSEGFSTEFGAFGKISQHNSTTTSVNGHKNKGQGEDERNQNRSALAVTSISHQSAHNMMTMPANQHQYGTSNANNGGFLNGGQQGLQTRKKQVGLDNQSSQGSSIQSSSQQISPKSHRKSTSMRSRHSAKTKRQKTLINNNQAMVTQSSQKQAQQSSQRILVASKNVSQKTKNRAQNQHQSSSLTSLNYTTQTQTAQHPQDHNQLYGKNQGNQTNFVAGQKRRSSQGGRSDTKIATSAGSDSIMAQQQQYSKTQSAAFEEQKSDVSASPQNKNEATTTSNRHNLSTTNSLKANKQNNTPSGSSQLTSVNNRNLDVHQTYSSNDLERPKLMANMQNQLGQQKRNSYEFTNNSNSNSTAPNNYPTDPPQNGPQKGNTASDYAKTKRQKSKTQQSLQRDVGKNSNTLPSSHQKGKVVVANRNKPPISNSKNSVSRNSPTDIMYQNLDAKSQQVGHLPRARLNSDDPLLQQVVQNDQLSSGGILISKSEYPQQKSNGNSKSLKSAHFQATFPQAAQIPSTTRSTKSLQWSPNQKQQKSLALNRMVIAGNRGDNNVGTGGYLLESKVQSIELQKQQQRSIVIGHNNRGGFAPTIDKQKQNNFQYSMPESLSNFPFGWIPGCCTKNSGMTRQHEFGEVGQGIHQRGEKPPLPIINQQFQGYDSEQRQRQMNQERDQIRMEKQNDVKTLSNQSQRMTSVGLNQEDKQNGQAALAAINKIRNSGGHQSQQTKQVEDRVNRHAVPESIGKMDMMTRTRKQALGLTPKTNMRFFSSQNQPERKSILSNASLVPCSEDGGGSRSSFVISESFLKARGDPTIVPPTYCNNSYPTNLINSSQTKNNTHTNQTSQQKVILKPKRFGPSPVSMLTAPNMRQTTSSIAHNKNDQTMLGFSSHHHSGLQQNSQAIGEKMAGTQNQNQRNLLINGNNGITTSEEQRQQLLASVHSYDYRSSVNADSILENLNALSVNLQRREQELDAIEESVRRRTEDKESEQKSQSRLQLDKTNQSVSFEQVVQLPHEHLKLLVKEKEEVHLQQQQLQLQQQEQMVQKNQSQVIDNDQNNKVSSSQLEVILKEINFESLILLEMKLNRIRRGLIMVRHEEDRATKLLQVGAPAQEAIANYQIQHEDLIGLCEEYWTILRQESTLFCKIPAKLYSQSVESEKELEIEIRKSFILKLLVVSQIGYLTSNEEFQFNEHFLKPMMELICLSFVTFMRTIIFRMNFQQKKKSSFWMQKMEQVVTNKSLLPDMQERLRFPVVDQVSLEPKQGRSELRKLNDKLLGLLKGMHDEIEQIRTDENQKEVTTFEHQLFGTVHEIVHQFEKSSLTADADMISFKEASTRVGRSLVSEFTELESNQDVGSNLSSFNDHHRSQLEGLPVNQNVKAPYLPALRKSTISVDAQKEYTLVLDLDETLVHFVEERNTVLVRPFAVEFLAQMSDSFEVVIFTAGTKEYADWALAHLSDNAAENFIDHRLYRDHTIQFMDVFIKDLGTLGRDLTKIIIVDNITENFLLQPENGISIKSWYDDPNDTCLEPIGNFLEQMVANRVADVRKAIRKQKESTLMDSLSQIEIDNSNQRLYL